MIWNFVLTVFDAIDELVHDEDDANDNGNDRIGMTMTMTVMMKAMMTWSMEQFDPNAVESFIMAGDGTKCCKKTSCKRN